MPNLNLSITSKGGSAHLVASKYIEKSSQWMINPDDKFVEINIIDSGWYTGGGIDLGTSFDLVFAKFPFAIDVGPITTKMWDWAQSTGSVEIIRLITWLHNFTSIYIPIFRYKTYELLQKIEDIDKFDNIYLHNTQPVCMGAMIEAVALFNQKQPSNKKVKFINHFIDLPTEFTSMIMREVDKTSAKHLIEAQFVGYSCPPVVETHDLTEKQILQRQHARMKELYPKLYTGLKEDDEPRIKFSDGYIRSAFTLVKHTPAQRQKGVEIFFPDFVLNGKSLKSGGALLHKVLDETFTDNSAKPLGEYNGCSANIQITDTDEVISIMLGSQASVRGTLAVIRAEIENAKTLTAPSKKIFVFCSNGLKCYEEVVKLARIFNKQSESGITILPLNNQPDSTIANLYSMANKIILRPGGGSIMETIAATKLNKKSKIICYTELSMFSTIFNYFRQLFGWSEASTRVYYETQPMSFRNKELIAWEEGNAHYISDVCVDELGLSRVRLANMYTYSKELNFFIKLDQAKKLLSDKKHLDVFYLLLQDKTLNTFIFTSKSEENKLLDIACIVEIINSLNYCAKQLDITIKNNPGLEKLKDGPAQTLELINDYKKSIEEKLKSQNSEDIVTHAKRELQKICESFKLAMTKVKQSWFPNLKNILQGLKKIYSYLISTLKAIFSSKKKLARSENILSEVEIMEGVVKLPVLVARRIDSSKIGRSGDMGQDPAVLNDETSPIALDTVQFSLGKTKT